MMQTNHKKKWIINWWLILTLVLAGMSVLVLLKTIDQQQQLQHQLLHQKDQVQQQKRTYQRKKAAPVHELPANRLAYDHFNQYLTVGLNKFNQDNATDQTNQQDTLKSNPTKMSNTQAKLDRYASSSAYEALNQLFSSSEGLPPKVAVQQTVMTFNQVGHAYDGLGQVTFKLTSNHQVTTKTVTAYVEMNQQGYLTLIQYGNFGDTTTSGGES